MKFRKVLPVLLSIPVFFLTHSVVNANEKVESVQKVETYSKNGIDFTIETTINNGATIYTLRDENENLSVEQKRQASKAFDEMVDKKVAEGKVNKKLKAAGRELHDATERHGYDSKNIDAQITGQWAAEYELAISDYNFRTVDGMTEGYWDGTSPVLADMFVFSSAYSFSSSKIIYGWPPSFEKVDDTMVWESKPIKNVYRSTVTRDDIELNSSAPITKFKVKDKVDMYVGKNIYKPSVTLTLDFGL